MKSCLPFASGYNIVAHPITPPRLAAQPDHRYWGAVLLGVDLKIASGIQTISLSICTPACLRCGDGDPGSCAKWMGKLAITFALCE